MNLNNFVVLPSKPKSMKLNVRNLQELRMEKVQLDKQTKEMESKLEELRERMSQEKEEREKNGRSHWRSAQPGVLAPVFHDTKTNKENVTRKLSPGKMKIRVLKDEPLPVVQKQMVKDAAMKTGTNRKLRLKGKVCGQCEVQLAGLMCSECGEDYCVGCFVKFHQKGALQRHRMIPIQAQLQTPVTTRDVLGRVQQQVRHEQSQLTRDTVPKSADERETNASEQTPVSENVQPVSEDHTRVLFVNDEVDVENDESAEEGDSSLLRGTFNEEESARYFQEALKEWREKERTGDAFTSRPTAARAVSAMETQTEKRHQPFIHLEFREDNLSYMEKLLLKQSRRGQIDQFQSQSDARHRPDPTTPPPAETDELSEKLTAEQMELRKYFASLFTVVHAEDAGKPSGSEESSFSITELDEMDTDATKHRPFGVKEENESKMFTSVGNGGEIGCSTSPLSQMTRGLKLISYAELRPQSQETDQFMLSLSKSESSPILQTSLQGSQHLTAVTEGSESFLNVTRDSQIDEHEEMLPTTFTDSQNPKSRTRLFTFQDSKSSVPVSPSSPLSPRTEVNATRMHSDVISSPGSSSSTSSSIRQQSPKPSDSPSSKSRLASPRVKPVNSRLDHQISHVISSSCTAASSRLSSASVHDFIRSPVPKISSHTDEHNSPSPSRWLKGARRSPKTTMLSLQLSMSDSEEDVTGEDVCLLPSEEDSSDEELRCINDSEVKRNTVCPTVTPSSDSLFTFQRLSKSERENIEAGLLTESSQALRSVARRQDVRSGRDGGLEGFFTLGLETGDARRSPTPAQTSRETQNITECSLVQGFWRPGSSLGHNAEEELVRVLSTLYPVTPRHGTMSSQRNHKGVFSRCPPSSSRIQSGSTHRPGSSFRPLSRAAQEILEVQTVERPEDQNSDEEDEDCQALACLEEEFRNMSSASRDQDKD